jgi:hypothetical protein
MRLYWTPSSLKGKVITFLGRRRNRILLLVIFCSILANVAYVLYPTLSAPPASGGVQNVTITTSSPVSRAEIGVSRGRKSDDIKLDVTVWSNLPRAQDATVHLILPESALPKNARCPAQAVCGELDTGEPVATITFPLRWRPTGFDQSVAFGASSELDIPDIGFGVAENKEFISVARPSIAVYSQFGNTIRPNSSAVILYTLHVPNVASYTWDGGATATAPIVDPNELTWIYPQSQLPVDPLNENVPPILDSGVNLGVQSEDDRNLFISGILLGIVGGAFIAATQELFAGGEESKSFHPATSTKKPDIDDNQNTGPPATHNDIGSVTPVCPQPDKEPA